MIVDGSSRRASGASDYFELPAYLLRLQLQLQYYIID